MSYTFPSILDTDFYKLTMQQAILELYPDAVAEYGLVNRRNTPFLSEDIPISKFVAALEERIHNMSKVALTLDEKAWLKTRGIFKPGYLEYLQNFRYDPNQIELKVAGDGIDLKVKGDWHSSMMWEVPGMFLISDTYFDLIGNDWNDDGQSMLAYEKGKKLMDAGCKWADFGTRRRRSLETQESLVAHFATHFQPSFVGTSNVYLAYKYNLRATGTQGHEFPMGVSALEGLLHANRFSMQKWNQVYEAKLGTVLPDTFGTDAFFADFTKYYAELFDSIRHDSGDPFLFARKVIHHYQKLGIDPLSKTIIFSDNLNTDLAIELNEFCKGLIKCSFGIGTHFTNDFPNSKFKALNIVIKLLKMNGIPVVKISDEPAKAIGERDALRVARYVFFGTPLDEEKKTEEKKEVEDDLRPEYDLKQLVKVVPENRRKYPPLLPPTDRPAVIADNKIVIQKHINEKRLVLFELYGKDEKHTGTFHISVNGYLKLITTNYKEASDKFEELVRA